MWWGSKPTGTVSDVEVRHEQGAALLLLLLSQVLRDLALLQIQMRDLPGFLESRQQLLDLKPANKQNWVALALAHHLAGNQEVAARVLDAYIGGANVV
mgnify:FL=1